MIQSGLMDGATIDRPGLRAYRLHRQTPDGSGGFGVVVVCLRMNSDLESEEFSISTNFVSYKSSDLPS